MFRFLGTFLGLEGKKQVQNIVQAMGQADPETMSEAQLIEMEHAADSALQLFAKLKVDWEREEKEAVEAERIVQITTAGAEEIQRRLETETDNAEKAKLNDALKLVVDRLEEVQKAAVQERAEADDAKSLLSDAETQARELTQNIVKAKATLASGARDMQRANMHAEVEERRAEAAAQVAGLRNNDSGNLNAAVNAFAASTNKANQRAEAARLKTKTLRDTSQQTGDTNPIIQDVMKHVENQGSDSSLSPAERLAQLTGKAPPASIAAPSSETTPHAS